MTLFEKLLGHTLITADNIWGLMGVMCIGVALSIFLEQKYQWASKVSGAIIALIMAMVLANLGVIPTNSALYDDIVWGVIVPMAIPLLLLQCNLSRVWKDTGRMLIVFLIGAVGTIVGAFIAYYVLRGPFGDAQGLAKVASMMTGSYIGGGVNFAAGRFLHRCHHLPAVGGGRVYRRSFWGPLPGQSGACRRGDPGPDGEQDPAGASGVPWLRGEKDRLHSCTGKHNVV